MAKIDAHGNRQIGPTLFTELTKTYVGDDGRPTTRYESWRLRSDGAILRRVIWSETEGEPRAQVDSGFHIVLRVRSTSEFNLRAYLARNGYTIVKER